MAHNISVSMLYLIPFLHQTTTMQTENVRSLKLYLIPFLHQTTTRIWQQRMILPLYLIPFLHQTTTSSRVTHPQDALYLIPFLHQTTTTLIFLNTYASCILFHFYIKPQPHWLRQSFWFVVSYSISTSNHNLDGKVRPGRSVVSYSISTSNHNIMFGHRKQLLLYLIPFLHQTTTYRQIKRFW